MSQHITFEEAQNLAKSPASAIGYALVLLERLCEAVEALENPPQWWSEEDTPQ